MIARRDGRPDRLAPSRTHGEPDSLARKSAVHRLPWRTAAECKSTGRIPVPSIFDTKEQIKTKLGLTACASLGQTTTNGPRCARDETVCESDADAAPSCVNLLRTGAQRRRWGAFSHNHGREAREKRQSVAPSITRFNGGAIGSGICVNRLSTITAKQLSSSAQAALAPLDDRPRPLLHPFLRTHPTVVQSALRSAEPLRTVTGRKNAARSKSPDPLAPLTRAQNTAGGEANQIARSRLSRAGGGHHGRGGPVLEHRSQGGRAKIACQ